MMWRVLVFLLTMLSVSAPAAAAPEPPARRAMLSDIEKRLEAEQSKARALEKESRQLEKALAASRESLVAATQRVRTAEKRVGAIENRIADLEQEKQALESRLEKDRGTIAALLLALQRLHRIPPEALMLRPGAPIEAARSTALMRTLLPPLRQRADSLRQDMARLEIVRVSLEVEHKKASAEMSNLKSQRTEMTALLKERESVYGKNKRAVSGQKETLRRISAQAKSLQDLVSRLEDNQRQQKSITSTALLHRPPETPMPRSGTALLPVSGIIKTRYGERDALGASSKGLSIDGISGGVVVAPMGGIVRYAGPFKGFGNIVIVAHEKGYHSLVAGLGKIDTVEGRSVTAGEPIGTLPGAGKGGRPTLYYELRQSGKPVDPSRKFADLG